MRRAQLRRELASRRTASPRGHRGPAEYLATARVLDVLAACTKRGQPELTTLLLACGIAPSQIVGDLTPTQCNALLLELGW